jgi:putative transposase
MPAPIAARIDLTSGERADLEALTRRHPAGQQRVSRARIVLAAADGQPNGAIAQAVRGSRETVRRWRQRWLGGAGVPLADLSVAERLADAPRPGRPAQLPAAPRCQLIALGGQAPPPHDRPISQWPGRELAAALVERGIGARISPRPAARRRKRGTSRPTASGIG